MVIESVNLDTKVEELIESYPQIAGFLAERSFNCYVCGEPFWGSLGELAESKNFKDIDLLIDEINNFIKDLKNKKEKAKL